MSTIPLSSNTFKEYIHEVFPANDDSGSRTKEILSNMRSIPCMRNEKLKSFACTLFPPIKVGHSGINGILLGDVLPQFTVTMSHKRYHFECVLCRIVCSGKMKSKPLEGVSQMYMHGLTTGHQNAIETILGTGSASVSQKAKNASPSVMLRFLGKASIVSRCQGIWDPFVVKHFANDQAINRMSVRKMFLHQTANTCTEHIDCHNFESWIKRHPDQYETLKKLSFLRPCMYQKLKQL